MLSVMKPRPACTLACLLLLLLLALAWSLSACAAAASTPPTPTRIPSLAPNDMAPVQSTGGGDPRGAGYWLLWNSCAPDNRAEVAAANGGRAMGWILLDDLLVDPGMLVGELQVLTCPQGLQLLQLQDAQGAAHPDDPAYQLASAMLTAQLNLAAGAEYCPAADQAVSLAQLLLLDIGFTARGDYPAAIQAKDSGEAVAYLLEQLTAYNLGTLCR